MTTPRIIADDALPITRIEVTGDLATERVLVGVDDQPRVAVTNTGENITVTISQSAAGANSVNGLQGDVVLTTTNIAEGSNLYYTNARADARVAAGIATIDYPVDSVNGKTNTVVLTTTDIAEGTNLYYTDARSRAAVSAGTGITYNSATGVIGCSVTDTNTTYTHNISTASSTGVYYNLVPSSGSTTQVKIQGGTGVTVTRANSTELDIAIGQAVTTSSNVTFNNLTLSGNLTVNGTTTTLNTATLDIEDNIITLNSNVTGTPTLDAGIEIERGTSLNSALTWSESTGKWIQNRAGGSYYIPISTDELGEGSTNKYYTDARSRAAVSAGTGITYNSSTGVIGCSITQYTDSNARSAVSAGTGLSYSSSTGVFTNTITQYTDALARAALSAGTGITYNNTTGVIGTSITQYTDAMARAAHSAGTGVTYNSSTGVISIGQAVGTTDSPTFNTVTANLATGKIVLGQLLATQNTSWTPPTNGLTTVTGNNGLQVSSSTGGANGYGASIGVTYYAGDTTASANSSANFIGRGATGTSSSPTAAQTNQVLMSLNADGYATNGWAGTIATTGSGAGTTSLAPAQIQIYAREAFADSAGSVTNAGTGFRVRLVNSATALTAANRIAAIDHTTASATYKSVAFNFQPASSTANYMTLGATTGSINQDTFTIKNNAASTTYAQFLSTGTTITGAGLHQITRTTVGTPGSVESRPSFNIQLSRSDQAAPQNGDGTSFRYRVNGSNNTNYTLADMSATYSSTGDYGWFLTLSNGDQTGATFSGVSTISSKVTETRIRAGTASSTAGGSSVSDKLLVDNTKVQAFVPVVFPSYTRSAANAVTGAVGWQIAISDSSGSGGGRPNGLMAYWDTTNSRWSYIHDNSAL